MKNRINLFESKDVTSLNESTVSFDSNKFVLNTFNTPSGLYLQFVPDGTTLDKGKDNLVKLLSQKLLKSKFGLLFEYDRHNDAAGIIFKLNKEILITDIEKVLK